MWIISKNLGLIHIKHLLLVKVVCNNKWIFSRFHWKIQTSKINRIRLSSNNTLSTNRIHNNKTLEIKLLNQELVVDWIQRILIQVWCHKEEDKIHNHLSIRFMVAKVQVNQFNSIKIVICISIITQLLEAQVDHKHLVLPDKPEEVLLAPSMPLLIKVIHIRKVVHLMFTNFLDRINNKRRKPWTCLILKIIRIWWVVKDKIKKCYTIVKLA